MSRQRNNFVFDRSALPSDVSFITRKSRDSLMNINDYQSNDNIDNSIKNKSGEGNVIFYKKPKFIGTQKEFTSKNSTVKFN